ncbi:MAG: enoyl-CoA hydratase/isomerase family protein [Acidimicrobiia bacterium]
MDQEPRIIVTVQEGVGLIRLNDPGSLNALSAVMASDLSAAIDDLTNDDAVRCLVLTGTGRGFCAGGDVQSFYENRDDPDDTIQATLDGLHGAINRLLVAPFPTIAAINGVVAGAGMGVAMATDLAIAAESAVFTMAYTGIGVSPDGSSTYFLPRLVGTRRAMHMILTNERIDAARAEELGLVNTVVPDEELSENVEALASKLAAGPTKAYVHARKLLRTSLQSDPATQMDHEAQGILAAGQTADFYEGVTAFIEKRRPEFRGS